MHSKRVARERLGRTTCTLLTDDDREWCEMAGRAILDGQLVVDLTYRVKVDMACSIGVGQVIHDGHCHFTCQDAGLISEGLTWR